MIRKLPPIVMLAVAASPWPPSSEVTGLVMLVSRPVAGLVTFTVIMQVPLAGIVPTASAMEPDPDTAVIAPPHVFVMPLGVATTKPMGNRSVNATWLRAVVALGLVIVKVKLVMPFTGSTATPKALLMVGGKATMVLAEAVLPLPPSMEVMADAVLFFNPAVVPVTITESMQVVLAGSVAPVKLNEPAPPVAVTVVRPQVFTSPLGVATTNPAGSVSVNPTPVKATLLVLPMVNVKLLF